LFSLNFEEKKEKEALTGVEDQGGEENVENVPRGERMYHPDSFNPEKTSRTRSSTGSGKKRET